MSKQASAFGNNYLAAILTLLILFSGFQSHSQIAMFHAHNQAELVDNILGITSDTVDAAYSFRKINNKYNGPCITVRKGGTLDTTTIYFVNNYVDTAAIKSFIGSANGYIIKWYDQSGNNKHVQYVTFPDSAANPKIAIAGVLIYINNKIAAEFDGADRLKTAIDRSYSDGSWLSFAVCRFTNLTGGQSVWDGDGNISGGLTRVGQFIRTNGTGSLTIAFTSGGGTPSDAGATLSTNTQYILAARRSDGTIQMYVNGTDGSSTSATGTNVTTTTTASISGSNSQRITGYVQEVIHWGKNVSSLRTDIRDNINTYYSIY